MRDLHLKYDELNSAGVDPISLTYIDSEGKKIKVRSPSKEKRKQINIVDKQDAIMPDRPTMPRLYGHYMCPFVEKVRLVLAYK